MQEPVEKLVQLGPIPGEADEDAPLEEWETALREVARPITDTEAEALVTLFPPDLAYGLGFTLLHLVENAPTWRRELAQRITQEEWRERALKGLSNADRWRSEGVAHQEGRSSPLDPLPSEEARVTLRTVEEDRSPDLPRRVAAALRTLVEDVRPDEPVDTTSEEWHPFEHSVWRLFARVQECMRERTDLRGKGPVLDAVAELCLDPSLGRGRQLGALLLGERGAGRYDDVLNRLLHDADVYGHALDSLAKSCDRSERTRVEEILKTEKHGWIRRAAKKYISGK